MEDNATYIRYIYMSLSHVFSIPLPSLYKSDYYFTTCYRYHYTFSRLCMLIELRKAAHHTTHRTKQLHIRDFPTRYPIRYFLRNAYQHTSTRHRRHRSRRLTSARVVTRLFVYSRCKFIPSLTFRVSLIPLCIFYKSVRIQLRRRRTRPRASQWTTVTHHRILPHPIRTRQCRTTSPSAQLNNSA